MNCIYAHGKLEDFVGYDKVTFTNPVPKNGIRFVRIKETKKLCIGFFWTLEVCGLPEHKGLISLVTDLSTIFYALKCYLRKEACI